MLWFCLSNADVLSDGTERFFQYLGGEAIYMPLSRYEKLCAKLKSLGRAVVVEVALSPPELSVFSDVPFAIVSLSRAHCRMNPGASRLSREGHMRRGISPAEILEVVPLEAFTARWGDSVSEDL